MTQKYHLDNPKKKSKKNPIETLPTIPFRDVEPVTRMTTMVDASALNDDSVNCRDTCPVCLDLMSIVQNTFYSCCGILICTSCSVNWRQYDTRCPYCLEPEVTSNAERICRIQKHADNGNAETLFRLGVKYHLGGYGFKKNLKRAFQFYELAAAQRMVLAQTMLGMFYEQGRGIDINWTIAVKWYRLAAEQGHSTAQAYVGRMFYYGKGVTQSFDESVRWFRLGAAKGNPPSLYNLGWCLEKGLGAPQDIEEALYMYKIAANKRHAGAALRIYKIEQKRTRTRRPPSKGC
jgi:hypothetical protein